MAKKYSTFAVLAAAILITAVCAKQTPEVTELKQFPLDSLEGVIDLSKVELDKEVSSDGNGAVRISVPESTTVRLLETGNMDVENARLVYQARVRTENLEGRTYLEMLCHFPGQGDFFSRGPQSPLTGTTGWTTEETFFFLKEGEKPDIIKLNLVVAGSGTVWVDDIRLLKAPLK